RMMKASFLIDQLERQVPFESLRFTMEDKDLIHLGEVAIYGGPGGLRTKRIQYRCRIMNEAETGAPYRPDVPIEIDPYSGVISYRDFKNPNLVRYIPIDLAAGVVNDKGLYSGKKSLIPDADKAAIMKLVNNFDRNVVQIEDD